MAVTAHASGTQTTTVTTEHSLSTVTVTGSFQLYVDLAAMQDGDVVELRIKQKVLTGGTQRGGLAVGYYGAQPTDDLVKISVPVSNEISDAGSIEFTLLQTFGTSRNFPWKVLKYA
jgi:hypothetical protein